MEATIATLKLLRLFEGLSKWAKSEGGHRAWYGAYMGILSGLPKSTEHSSRGPAAIDL